MTTTRIVELIDSKGTVRTVRMDDGSIMKRSGGTASWRNNNPGNLKLDYAGSADHTSHVHRSYHKALDSAQHSYVGVIALDQRGNAIFESPEAGRAAQLQALRHRFGHMTVEEMVHAYSKPDYSGPTHYPEQLRSIHRTATSEGIDLHGKTILSMTQRELDALADGIAHFEGYRVGEVKALSGPALHAAQSLPTDAAPNRASQPMPAPVSHASPSRLAQAHADRHASLHAGDHGTTVRNLQEELNRLGYRDAHGHRLAEDGRFGHRTHDAVAAFQDSHHLPGTGTAGPRTRAALDGADARLVTSPSNPGHNAFAEVLRHLHAAETAHGMPSGEHSIHVASALLVEARRDKLQRIDRVEINRDGSLVRAVQVSPLRDEPGLNRATQAIDMRQAAHQSIHASSEQLAQIDLDSITHAPAQQRTPRALSR